MDTWQMIRAERSSLVDGLAALPETDWSKPSLCADWTVREVVGHLISTATLTPPAFFGKLIASGFSFSRMTSGQIARVTADRSPSELVAALAARVGSRNAPPGPTPSWLGETIVHGEDVFRALGGYHDHPVAHLVAVANFYRGSNLLIGTKSRIDGVTLKATDADWRHGSGPEVSGPMVALVMAMTGRTVALDDVSGEGVALLRGRS
jgi:uncharacterized protein (TIGR03083 family)